MDSEASAYLSAQKKHHKFIVCGKKQRYIEVFQCSGDDMNMVLTGGGMHHTPSNSKPPLLSPGMLHSPPTQHQQGQLHSQHQQPPPSAAHLQHSSLQHSSTHTGGLPPQIPSPLSLSIPPPNSALLAQHQAQFIAQQTLLARQNAAAVAAAQEQMYQNFGFLPPHHQAQLAAASQSNQYAAHYAAAAAAQNGGPGATYLFAPRPLMTHPQFQHMGYYPNAATAMHPQLAQYAAAAAAAGNAHGGQAQTATSSAAAGAGAGAHHQSVKRSYDHAFHNDPAAVNSASKRAYPPPMSTAATAAYYSQFYPPGM